MVVGERSDRSLLITPTADRTRDMTLRSSAANRVAQAISRRQGILGYLLGDERVLRYIDDRPRVLLRILEASERLPRLLAKPETRDALGLDQSILDWFEPERRLDSVGDDLILIYLKQEIDRGALSLDQLLTQLDIRKLLDHLGPERMLNHLGPERMLDHLGPERMLNHLGPERMLDHLGPERMLNHLGPERMLDHLGPERMLNHLGPERMLDHLGPERMLNHLGPERMLNHLGPERMLDHLGPERMLNHLGPERMLNHLGPERMLDHLGPERMLNHLGPERMLDHLGPEQAVQHFGLSRLVEHIDMSQPVVLASVIENDKALRRLINDERAINKVCLDESLLGPERMLNHLGPERMLDHLGPERMLNHLGPERMLDHLGPEQAVQHFGLSRLVEHIDMSQPVVLASVIENDKALRRLINDERAINKVCLDESLLGPERMLNHLGPERMLDHLGPERMLNHLGAERMLDHLGPEQAVQHFGLSRLVEHIDMSQPVVLASVIENDKALRRLINDERAINKVCLDESLKRRFRFVNAQRVAADLPYRLPGVIVSYPRSGSNFVQSVLRHSTGLTNLSIYASNSDGIDITLTVKSHAPSPEYLRDEFGRLVGDPAWPARVVLLQRDPRDAMISFYEYTQHMRQTAIPQEDFLEQHLFLLRERHRS